MKTCQQYEDCWHCADSKTTRRSVKSMHVHQQQAGLPTTRKSVNNVQVHQQSAGLPTICRSANNAHPSHNDLLCYQYDLPGYTMVCPNVTNTENGPIALCKWSGNTTQWNLPPLQNISDWDQLLVKTLLVHLVAVEEFALSLHSWSNTWITITKCPFSNIQCPWRMILNIYQLTLQHAIHNARHIPWCCPCFLMLPLLPPPPLL